MGTHLPITSQLEKYIRFDLQDLKCKSILIYLNETLNDPIGHVLVYPIKGTTLGFGYFKVKDDHIDRIDDLLDILEQYARDNAFEAIYGPLNVPIYIFGFGFLFEGENLFDFVCASNHPFQYYQRFESRKYSVKSIYCMFDVGLIPIDPYAIPGVDFSEYELETPKSKEEFLEVKDEWLELHANHMPSEIRLTPNPLSEIENMMNFIFEFGYPFLIFWVRDKQTGKIVAAGMAPPNCFELRTKGSKAGKAINALGLDFVVDKSHQSKKLSILMWGATSLPVVYKMKGKRCMYLVDKHNEKSVALAKKLGGIFNRSFKLFIKYL